MTVPCPFCAEPIQQQARKCRHCDEWLVATAVAAGPPGTGADTWQRRALADTLLFGVIFVTICLAIVATVLSNWLVGFAVFCGLIGLATCWYRR